MKRGVRKVTLIGAVALAATVLAALAFNKATEEAAAWKTYDGPGYTLRYPVVWEAVAGNGYVTFVPQSDLDPRAGRIVVDYGFAEQPGPDAGCRGQKIRVDGHAGCRMRLDDTRELVVISGGELSPYSYSLTAENLSDDAGGRVFNEMIASFVLDE